LASLKKLTIHTYIYTCSLSLFLSFRLFFILEIIYAYINFRSSNAVSNDGGYYYYNYSDTEVLFFERRAYINAE